LLGVGLIFLLLLYFRFHPFLALVISAFSVSFASKRIPLEEAIPTVTDGFASLMGKIGILLVLAAIVGKCLVDSGAADQIVRSFTRAFGKDREQYSFLASGFILSMPVFFDTVFYLLAPLVRAAYARRKRDYAMMICAVAAGGAVTHALVPPTPGPVVVAEALGVSLGTTFLIGALAAIVPSIVGGVWYANYLNRRIEIRPREVYGVSEAELEKLASRRDSELPSLVRSLSPIAMPIGLITMSTLAEVLTSDERILLLLSVVGNKDVAFLVGAAFAVWLVTEQKRLSLRKVFKTLDPAVRSGAVIAFITCAGGAFGSVLTSAGVGDVIAETARDWGMSLLVLAFIIAALLRIAQGSATVAMITTAGIIGPAMSVTDMSFHPVYLVAMIGFGATTTPWMNDSGFWIVGRLGGLSEAETVKVWTILLTVLAVSGFLWVMLLSKVLPLA
jgi:GntP family gluconate:H+ symporter